MKKQINPELLKKLCEDGNTIREMAIKTGWSTTTIGSRLKQYGLKIKPIPKKPTTYSK